MRAFMLSRKTAPLRRCFFAWRFPQVVWMCAGLACGWMRYLLDGKDVATRWCLIEQERGDRYSAAAGAPTWSAQDSYAMEQWLATVFHNQCGYAWKKAVDSWAIYLMAKVT